MSKANLFTKGEWSACNKTHGDNIIHIKCTSKGKDNGEVAILWASAKNKNVFDDDLLNAVNSNDANLIATAGTTATKLSEMGYDAVKLIEALPDIASIIQKQAKIILISIFAYKKCLTS